jgi:hypothetical protein
MKRLDNHEIKIESREILGFLRIRNESLRLPWFLDEVPSSPERFGCTCSGYAAGAGRVV